MRRAVLAIVISGGLLGVLSVLAEGPASKPASNWAASVPASSMSAASPDAQKILKAVDLWADGLKQEAVNVFMSVNWAAKIQFPATAYLFVLSEKQFTSMPPVAQETTKQDFMKTYKVLNELVGEVQRQGEEAMGAKDFAKAEKRFQAELGLGRLMNRPDRLLLTRLTGVGRELRALTNMVSLYQAMSKPEQVKVAQQELDRATQDRERIKAEVRAMSPQQPTQGQ